MKPQNIKEFKALIKRYESITAEEIEDSRDNWGEIRHDRLTGFGNASTCSLCKPCMNDKLVDCAKCVYAININYTGQGCYPCISRDGVTFCTYNDIDEAYTPEELLLAYKARAKHMRGILKQLNSKK